MSDKKYAAPSESPYPHVGKMLKKAIKNKGLSQAEVARRLSIADTGMSRYFRQSSLQLGILWNAGLAINHNIIGDIASAFPVQQTSEKVLMLQERIKDLEKEVAIYKALIMGNK